MELIKIANKNLAKISIITFLVLTFVYSFLKVPFFDESYSYLISRLSLGEIFYLSRIEGHPVLWYLLLKPFTFNQNLYPYPMMFLNWVISSFLIVFLWKKAPFNNFVKFLITFSYPFFNYFAVFARPYGLTCLLMFICSFLFREKFKKPILFSLALLLLSNTTVVGMISAFCFYVLFLFDLLKEKVSKKDLFFIVFILILNVLIIFAQFFNIEIPMEKSEFYKFLFLKRMFTYFVFPFYQYSSQNFFQILFKIFYMTIFYSSFFVFYKKDKKAFFYLVLNLVLLTLVFTFTNIGNYWHQFFFIVNLLVSYWLCFEKVSKIKWYNIVFTIFLILTLNPFSFFKNGYPVNTYTKNYMSFLNKILSYKDLKESKIFCLEYYSSLCPGLLPYLSNKGYKLYDLEGNERTTFKSLRNTTKLKYKPLEADKFAKVLDDKKENYIISRYSILSKVVPYPDMFEFKGDEYTIKLYLLDFVEDYNFAVYKIVKEKNVKKE